MELIKILPGNSGPIPSVTVIPDSKYIVSATGKKIKIWNY